MGRRRRRAHRVGIGSGRRRRMHSLSLAPSGTSDAMTREAAREGEWCARASVGGPLSLLPSFSHVVSVSVTRGRPATAPDGPSRPGARAGGRRGKCGGRKHGRRGVEGGAAGAWGSGGRESGKMGATVDGKGFGRVVRTAAGAGQGKGRRTRSRARRPHRRARHARASHHRGKKESEEKARPAEGTKTRRSINRRPHPPPAACPARPTARPARPGAAARARPSNWETTACGRGAAVGSRKPVERRTAVRWSSLSRLTDAAGDSPARSNPPDPDPAMAACRR